MRVAALNDRDGTNADVRGTKEYSSLRRLTRAQLLELAHEFRKKARLPPANTLPSGPRGGRARRPMPLSENVTYIATQGERVYLEHLFDLVKWSDEAQAAFIDRQTKGAGLTTHRALNAVIAPLERILRARGWTCVERGRAKTWSPPPLAPHPEACCARAVVRPCVCRVSFSCEVHGTRCVGSHD